MAKPIAKPNGKRVTQAQLYKALYQLDQNVAEAITAVHDAITNLTGSFESHRADGHPFTQEAKVQLAKHGVDGKRIAFLTGILALAATLGAVVLKALEMLPV